MCGLTRDVGVQVDPMELVPALKQDAMHPREKVTWSDREQKKGAVRMINGMINQQAAVPPPDVPELDADNPEVRRAQQAHTLYSQWSDWLHLSGWTDLPMQGMTISELRAWKGPYDCNVRWDMLGTCEGLVFAEGDICKECCASMDRTSPTLLGRAQSLRADNPSLKITVTIGGDVIPTVVPVTPQSVISPVDVPVTQPVSLSDDGSVVCPYDICRECRCHFRCFFWECPISIHAECRPAQDKAVAEVVDWIERRAAQRASVDCVNMLCDKGGVAMIEFYDLWTCEALMRTSVTARTCLFGLVSIEWWLMRNDEAARDAFDEYYDPSPTDTQLIWGNQDPP